MVDILTGQVEDRELRQRNKGKIVRRSDGRTFSADYANTMFEFDFRQGQ
jgi:hypothetical protein